jgi:ribosomal protein L40E
LNGFALGESVVAGPDFSRGSKSLKNKAEPKCEVKRMAVLVYCTKCGAKNEDTAVACVKCGASLQTGTVESRRYERRRRESECFGLPHGGAIAGVIIGVLIFLWGFFELAKQQGWITQDINVWWLFIITIGLLMIAGAIYRATRRY